MLVIKIEIFPTKLTIFSGFSFSEIIFLLILFLIQFNSIYFFNRVWEKIFFRYLLIYIFSLFLVLFINSSRNSNEHFLRLGFAFDGSGSGSGFSAAFLSTSRIIEPYSFANLIALFLLLNSFLILANVFFCLSDLFPIPFFLDTY